MGDNEELADIVSYMSHAMSMNQFVKEFGLGEDVRDFVTGAPMSVTGSAPIVVSGESWMHASGVPRHPASVTKTKIEPKVSEIQRLHLPWISKPLSPILDEGDRDKNLFKHIGDLDDFPGSLCTRLRNAFEIVTGAMTPIECEQLQMTLGRYGKARGGSLRIVFEYAMRFLNSNPSGLCLHETLSFFDTAIGYAERNIASIRELEVSAELTREPTLVQGMTANKSEIRMTLEIYV